MSAVQFTSLLDAIEIPSIFVNIDLNDLLEVAASEDTSRYPSLILMAIERWDLQCELEEATSEQITMGHRGESSDDSAVFLPTTWALSTPVRIKLAEFLKISEAHVSAEALSFRKYILSDKPHKQLRSKNWTRSFTEYFVKSFQYENKTENNEAQEIANASGSSEKPENIAKINRIISGIVSEVRFKSRYKSYYSKWYPTAGLVVALLKQGFTREAIFSDQSIVPFRTKCEKEKIPLSKADRLYKDYINGQREILRRAIGE